MPSSSDDNITDVFQTNTIINYCFVSLSALMLYEYIITIGEEVQLIWSRKLASFSAFLFFMNRFVLIGLIVTGVLTIVPASNLLSCKDVSLPYGIFALFTYLIWAVVSAQRTCTWQNDVSSIGAVARKVIQ